MHQLRAGPRPFCARARCPSPSPLPPWPTAELGALPLCLAGPPAHMAGAGKCTQALHTIRNGPLLRAPRLCHAVPEKEYAGTGCATSSAARSADSSEGQGSAHVPRQAGTPRSTAQARPPFPPPGLQQSSLHISWSRTAAWLQTGTWRSNLQGKGTCDTATAGSVTLSKQRVCIDPEACMLPITRWNARFLLSTCKRRLAPAHDTAKCACDM